MSSYSEFNRWFAGASFLVIACLAKSAGADYLPANLPPHPRILFNASDLSAIKNRVANCPWAKAQYDRLQSQANNWLQAKIVLPAKGSQWYHYYSCPKHGSRLRTEGPTRHVCPIDGEVFSGYPYDDVVLAAEHTRLATGIRTLGIVYQITGKPEYAAKAREILLAYANKYDSYPLHDIRGEAKTGGGKVGPQTLDESVWLITVVEGADCVWSTLSAADKAKVKSGLLDPATEIIRRHKMKIHNIQCWKNSAVGLTGLLLGDERLMREAIQSEVGYFKQIEQGVTPDGLWYEGAWGYHFYTLSALIHLTEGALHSGIDLYTESFKSMFDAPLAFAMPDLCLPPFNDSGIVSVLNQFPLYEIALARFHDPRYARVIVPSNRNSDASLLYGLPKIRVPARELETSHNFPRSGYAILTAGTGTEATWLCLDYGPHGGGHGHPDKLGFELFSLGQVIAPDPGTANYGVPIQSGWYRTTLAHNTLTVDETSQNPAEGHYESFITGEGYSAITVDAGAIYGGLLFHRTIALIGNRLLVFIDQIKAEEEHTLDLAYHNYGKILTPFNVELFRPSGKPGYSYLREARSLSSSKAQRILFDLGDNRQVWQTIAGGEFTAYIIGTGVGANTEDRVPIVIARRQAKGTVFYWTLTLGTPAEPAQVTAEPVTLSDGSRPETTELAAARITTSKGNYILLVNPAGAQVVVAGLSCTDKLVCLRQDQDGNFRP